MSATARDLYVNFAVAKSAYDAANTTTLMHATIETGLSIRGGLAWLIHFIDFWFAPNNGANAHTQSLALSTRRDLAAMPGLGDQGLIDRCDTYFLYSTAIGQGWYPDLRPVRRPFLPPIPIASPAITLYNVVSINEGSLQGKEVIARIGFTTVPMSNALYTEIAEVWGW